MLSRGFIRKIKHTHTWLTFVLSLLLWNCKSKTVYITLKKSKNRRKLKLLFVLSLKFVFFFVNKSKFVVEKTQKWLAIQNCDLENKNFHTPAPNLVERNDWRTDCGTVCVRNKTKKNPQGWNFFPTPDNLLGCKLATE